MCMTLTEHIQDVASNIANQRNELSELQAQRKQAGIMTGLWLAIYGMILSMSQPQTAFIILGFAFLAFNAYRLIRFERTIRLMSVLLSDNEHYKAIIVDEAYSGKEVGPQD